MVSETNGDRVNSELCDDERDTVALRVTEADTSEETEVEAHGVTVILFKDVDEKLTEPVTDSDRI